MIFDSDSEKRKCYKKNTVGTIGGMWVEFESGVRDIKQKLKNVNNWWTRVKGI